MHDKKTRRAALKLFYGTDPIPAGLEAELDKVDFDLIRQREKYHAWREAPQLSNDFVSAQRLSPAQALGVDSRCCKR
jgi:hypothetical protein